MMKLRCECGDENCRLEIVLDEATVRRLITPINGVIDDHGPWLRSVDCLSLKTTGLRVVEKGEGWVYVLELDD